jgi:hypothetical protein
MSPLPLFVLATAAMAAFAFYLLMTMLRRPAPVRRPLGLRQRRAEEQIRWDRMHPPATAD